MSTTLPRYKQIYRDILEKIETNIYQEGDKLPSEKELSEQYQVSRITSKQALELLAMEKRVYRKPGLGTFVMSQQKMQEAKQDCHKQQQKEKGKKTIGVIMDSFDFAFGCEMLKSIEIACAKQGVLMYLKCTYEDIQREKEAMEELIEQGVSGLIIMCVQNEIFNDEILRCSLDGFPVVLLDRTMAGVAIPCVTTDNYKATKELADKLFDLGHNNICFVSHENHQTPTIKSRFDAFTDSNLEHKIIVDTRHYIRNLKTCTPTGEDELDMKYALEDEEKIIMYLKENPQVTAFLTTQYVIGTIVFNAVKKMGRLHEIQIATFDGPLDSVSKETSFIRIVQGETQMGSKAVELLLQKMNHVEEEGMVMVPYQMILPEKLSK